jgi:hypothetical protein
VFLRGHPTTIQYQSIRTDCNLIAESFSTYDGSGDLTSVTFFGINVTSLFELPL